MTNSEMLKEVRLAYKLNKFEAQDFLRKRCEVVAGLANITWSGFTTKKGVLFSHMRGGPDHSCRVAHAWFDFETVLDTPTQVIDWAKRQDNRAVRPG